MDESNNSPAPSALGLGESDGTMEIEAVTAGCADDPRGGMACCVNVFESS